MKLNQYYEILKKHIFEYRAGERNELCKNIFDCYFKYTKKFAPEEHKAFVSAFKTYDELVTVCDILKHTKEFYSYNLQFENIPAYTNRVKKLFDYTIYRGYDDSSSRAKFLLKVLEGGIYNSFLRPETKTTVLDERKLKDETSRDVCYAMTKKQEKNMAKQALLFK